MGETGGEAMSGETSGGSNPEEEEQKVKIKNKN
jgi:hypothetical protein